MAKKVRRVRRKKRASQQTGKNKVKDVSWLDAADSQAPEVESSEQTVSNKASSRRRGTRRTGSKERATNSGKLTTEEELREEYAYVVYDLRRIAILAVAMFALLILLNILL